MGLLNLGMSSSKTTRMFLSEMVKNVSVLHFEKSGFLMVFETSKNAPRKPKKTTKTDSRRFLHLDHSDALKWGNFLHLKYPYGEFPTGTKIKTDTYRAYSGYCPKIVIMGQHFPSLSVLARGWRLPCN